MIALLIYLACFVIVVSVVWLLIHRLPPPMIPTAEVIFYVVCAILAVAVLLSFVNGDSGLRLPR